MCECKTNKSSNSKSISNHAVLYRVPKISLNREEQAEGLPLKCSASRLLDPFISSSSSSSVCTRDMFNDENNCVDWSLWNNFDSLLTFVTIIARRVADKRWCVVCKK